LSAGDLFSPEQPKPLNSKRLGIIWLALISGLESLNPEAYVKVDIPARATAKSMRNIEVLLDIKKGARL
jgi:hypothetical protein